MLLFVLKADLLGVYLVVLLFPSIGVDFAEDNCKSEESNTRTTFDFKAISTFCLKDVSHF